MSSAGDAQDSRGSEHGGAKPTPGPSRARSPSSHHPSSLAARSVFINGTPRHSLVSQSSRYSSSSSPFSSNGHSKDALITNGSSSGLQSQPTFLDDDQRSITRATSTILNDSFSSGSHQMSSSLPLSQAAPPCLPGSVPIRQTQLLDRPASSPLLTVPSLSESTSPSTSANLISSKPIRPSKFTPEGALPSVTLDPLPHEKSNYKCRYDPALDTSVVKKSAGPLYTHFKPSRSIISFPDRDPRLRLAYPTPIKSMPKTPAGRSALVAGLSRSSRGRQTYHSQVERLASYSYDRNSTGPPPPPPPAAVLITRLNKLVTGEQVRNHFSQFGRIAECELKLDPQMGGSLGICWLKFVDELNQTFEAGRSNISLKCRALSSANRGLQDGHRSALEAVKKADGARIGIMLTMGASQQTSSLRKPFRNVTPVGIKCVLDGEGKKCARAVDNELQKLYPPLPLYSPSHETTAGDDIIPPTSLNSLASQIHPTPSCFGTKQLEVRPPSPGGMPSLIERENSGVNSLNYPQISYQTPLQGHSDAANDSPHDTQGIQKRLEQHFDDPSSIVPKMPSAMRIQSATESLSNSSLASPHPMRDRGPSRFDQTQKLSQDRLTPFPSNFQQLYGNKPIALKTTHYFRQGADGGQHRSKVAAGFVAAAQNAAFLAAKKAGLRISAKYGSSGQPHSERFSGTATTRESGLESSVSVKKESIQSANERLENITSAGEDEDSESEDEDAREERQKEIAREALIHNRQTSSYSGSQANQTRFADSKFHYNVKTVFEPSKRIAESPANNFTTSQQTLSANISLLWPHNHIGIDKSIKIEILKRLAANSKSFITINRENLSHLEAELRLRYGQAELKGYFSNFSPDQVMTDGQMWYITFCDFEMAHKASLYFKSEDLTCPRLPLELREPISQDYYKTLVENNLQPPPSLGLKDKPKSLSSDSRLSEEDLVKQTDDIPLEDFKGAFLRGLKSKVVSGRAWERLQEDDRAIKISLTKAKSTIPPKVFASDPSSLDSIRRQNPADTASAIMRLPSFVKRKALQPHAASAHPLTKNSLKTSQRLSDKQVHYCTGHSVADGTSIGSTRNSHKFIEEDSMSVASSEFSHVSRHNNSRSSHNRSTKEHSGVYSDEEILSTTKIRNDDTSEPLIKKQEKNLHKRRFKKSINFTSSDDDANDSHSSKKNKAVIIKSKGELRDVSPKVENLMKLSSESLISQSSNIADIIIASSPLDELAELTSIDSKMTDSEELQEKQEQHVEKPSVLDIDKRPLKKIRLTCSSSVATSVQADYQVSGLPSLYDCGLAQDEEDLYYLKLTLARLRGGQSLHPPVCEKPVPPTNESGGGNHNNAGSSEYTAAATASSNPLSQEIKQELGSLVNQEFSECTLRPHATGSSRTEGYYRITSSQKAFYLPQRNKAIIDVGSLFTNQNNAASASALAVSRSTRVNSRRFVLNMEQNKKASTLASASIDTVTDALKFNQLRTRKKQLKFSRSPIHDWGLYAMEMIPAGEMVIEYVGEVIRQAVADRREKAYERMGIGSSYLFRVDDDLVVDATKKGNLGRLINHCCTPNCTAKIITINGEKKIVIYAKVTIELGDEVTYDYHFPKEDVKIPCLCGSVKCKGTLN